MKKSKRSLHLLLSLSLLWGCSSSTAPYSGGVSFLGLPVIKGVSNSTVNMGQKLTLNGVNFAQGLQNNQIQLTLSNGTTVPALLTSVQSKTLSFYVPILYDQKDTTSATVKLYSKGKKVEQEEVITISPPKLNSAQKNLVQNLRQAFVSGETYQSASATLKQDIENIFTTAENKVQAAQDVDLAVSVAAQSQLEYIKTAKLLSLIYGKTNSDKSTTNELAPSLSVQSVKNQSFETKLFGLSERLCEDNVSQKPDTGCPDEINDDNDLVVFYVNGMNTDLKGHCKTKRLLKEKIANLGIKADIAGMYQASLQHVFNDVENALDNTSESLGNFCDEKMANFIEEIHDPAPSCVTNPNLQNCTIGIPFDFFGMMYDTAVNEIPAAVGAGAGGTACLAKVGVDTTKTVVSGAKGKASTIGDFSESLFQRNHLQGFFGEEDACQVNDLATKLEKLLSQNKRIILIAHSQGNLYVTQALRELLKRTTGASSGSLNLSGTNLITYGSLKTGLSRNQVLNAIGVIWVASPVRIEDPSDINRIPDLVCNNKNLTPTCFPRYVGVRQDPVAHLRWMSTVQFLGLDLLTSNQISGFFLHPNDYKTQDNYSTEMFYSPKKANDILWDLDIKNPNRPNEKLDFSFEHHDMDNVYLFEGTPNHPNFSGKKPWDKIKESLIELDKELIHPIRNNLDLTLE